ncbi:MAG TPA: PilZ domain-containing protein [Croceibacterium sp.]|nr:PilZ domain-containing protein [Croceibacterium sp.]
MNLVSSVSHAGLDTRYTDRQAVYRPVLIESHGATGFCLLRDVSADGLRAKAYTAFAPDEHVRVHFSSDISVSGAIAWSEDGQIGVAFNEIIDVPELLSQFAPGTAMGWASRSQRLPIHCSAHLAANGRTAMVQLLDISQHGIKACASFLEPGDELDVKLDGLERRKAVVIWIKSQLAGLKFVRPLGFEDLACWVACQQEALLGGKP